MAVAVKDFEYSAKFPHHGLFPSTNNFLAIYFTLTGLHMLHVVGGMAVNAYFLGPGAKLWKTNPVWFTNRLPPGLHRPSQRRPSRRWPPRPAPPAHRVSASPRRVPASSRPSSPRKPGDTTPKVFTGHPIWLDFQGVDLRAVLRTFAEITGLNLVIDRRCKGAVDVSLRDVPWIALDIILRADSSATRVDGTIVRIAPATCFCAEGISPPAPRSRRSPASWVTITRTLSATPERRT